MNQELFEQLNERLKKLEKRIFIDMDEGRRIEPKRSLYTDFPNLKGEKFYLKKWVGGTKVSVFITGRRQPQTFHYSYFRL